MTPTRFLFTITLMVGLLWLLGFVIEPFVDREPSIITLAAMSIAISSVISYLLYKYCPNFLKVEVNCKVSVVKYYILSIICSYFLLIPVIGIGTYLQVRIFGDINHNEAQMYIIVMAIWFPLWWFIPTGLVLRWVFYKKRVSRLMQNMN